MHRLAAPRKKARLGASHLIATTIRNAAPHSTAHHTATQQHLILRHGHQSPLRQSMRTAIHLLVERPMKVVRVRLKSVSPYSQSKAIGVEKNGGEGADDFERRTWRERCHADADGLCYIPPMSFKKALDAAARYSSVKVPGKGSATYSKHVESGTFIMEPLPLGVKKSEVVGEWLFLDANGKKGKASSGRVMRCMPKHDHWEGEVTIHVIDETVLQTSGVRDGERKLSVLEHFLRVAGSLIGVGRFRPENGGFYGRFVVVSFEVMEAEGEAA